MATSCTNRLDCPVCKKKMTQPTSFKCRHFFCQTCVDEMPPVSDGSLTRYKCPVCGDLTANDGCSAMYFVTNLMDNDIKQEQKEKPCDQCQTEVPTHRCLDCKQSFCNGCRDNHNRWQAMKNHKWEEPTDNTDMCIDEIVYCSEHSDECTKLHCEQCQQLICMVCAETSHKGHPLEAITVALEKSILNVQQQIDDIGSVVQDNEKSLDQTISYAEGLKKEYEDMEKKIDKTCEEIIRKARADCIKAKEEMALIKGRQIDSVEKYIKDLEVRIKSGKNTLILSDTALRWVKHTSLLHMIQSNLTDRLNNSANERHSEHLVTMPIRASFTPRSVKVLNSIGTVHGLVRLSNHIPRDLTELSTHTATVAQTHNVIINLKLRPIGKQLWGIKSNSNSIFFLSLDFKDLGNKALKGIGHIRSFTQFDSLILIAASNGLYHVDLDAENIQTIMRGDFCDVAVRNDRISALDNGSGIILMFEYDNERNIFTKQEDSESLQIKSYNQNAMNTIHSTPEHIYLAEFEAHRIRKYNLKGTLITTLGSKGKGVGQFTGPRICGSDEYNTLLIADTWNNRLQILNSEGSCQVLKFNNLSYPVFAAFVQGSIVVSGFFGGIKCFTYE